MTEKLSVYVEDGGRFDWEKDLPSAIDRMMSENYAFMSATQAMYLESRKQQNDISIIHPVFLEAKGKKCAISEGGKNKDKSYKNNLSTDLLV